MSEPARHPLSTGIVFGIWALLNFVASILTPMGLPFVLSVFNTLVGLAMVWSIVEDVRRAEREDD